MHCYEQCDICLRLLTSKRLRLPQLLNLVYKRKISNIYQGLYFDQQQHNKIYQTLLVIW